MPTICIINGIRILIHLRSKEHNPPHIHAVFQQYEAIYSLSDEERLDGLLPSKEEKIVKSFIKKYRQDLINMWNSESYEKIEFHS